MTAYITARRAARQPRLIYRDHHDRDVCVEGASEEGGGKRVVLRLEDGRSAIVDWDCKLRVVRPGRRSGMDARAGSTSGAEMQPAAAHSRMRRGSA